MARGPGKPPENNGLPASLRTSDRRAFASTFEQHAQNGRGSKRPAGRAGEFRCSLAARIRTLWVFAEHAQNGRGSKRPAGRAREFRCSLAARIRTLCAANAHDSWPSLRAVN